MYIVGGFLGYQWADFHCDFEMTFLCEFGVNNQVAWRRRRRLSNTDMDMDDEEANWISDEKEEEHLYLKKLKERMNQFDDQEELNLLEKMEKEKEFRDEEEIQWRKINLKSGLFVQNYTKPFNTTILPKRKKWTGYYPSQSHQTILPQENGAVISKKKPTSTESFHFQLDKTENNDLEVTTTVAMESTEGEEEDSSEKSNDPWSIFNLIKANIAKLG